MWDPFTQLFQHCWGHARLLRMDYKDLRVVFFPRCTAGPKLVGSCLSVCTPLPTGCNKSQHCWHNNVGSCRARLHAVLVSPFPLFLKGFRKKAGFVNKTKIWPKKYCKNQDRHSLELKFEHGIIIMENAIKINIGIAQRFKQ